MNKIKSFLNHWRLLRAAARLEAKGAYSTESNRANGRPVYLACLAKHRPELMVGCFIVSFTLFWGLLFPVFVTYVAPKLKFSDSRWGEMNIFFNLPFWLKLVPWCLSLIWMESIWCIWKDIRSIVRNDRLWKHVAEVCGGTFIWTEAKHWPSDHADLIGLTKKTIPEKYWGPRFFSQRRSYPGWLD